MRIEKHLIGQTFIVRYMEDTDSDILGLGIGFLITPSNYSLVVINVDIEPWSRLP